MGVTERVLLCTVLSPERTKNKRQEEKIGAALAGIVRAGLMSRCHGSLQRASRQGAQPTQRLGGETSRESLDSCREAG